MGRPKKGAKKVQKTVERPPDERVAVIHLKGTPEYAKWMEYLHRDTLIPKAAIVRDALAEWAAKRGKKKPPEH